jgi:hypothetical protein
LVGLKLSLTFSKDFENLSVGENVKLPYPYREEGKQIGDFE